MTASVHLREDEKLLVRSLRRLPLRDRQTVFGMVANASTATPARPPMRSKKNGYPCMAVPSCSRTDLKTEARSLVHVTTNADLVVKGHIAKK